MFLNVLGWEFFGSHLFSCWLEIFANNCFLRRGNTGVSGRVYGDFFMDSFNRESRSLDLKRASLKLQTTNIQIFSFFTNHSQTVLYPNIYPHKTNEKISSQIVKINKKANQHTFQYVNIPQETSQISARYVFPQEVRFFI